MSTGAPPRITWRGSVAAPRWAKMPEFLRMAALHSHVDIKLDVEKRLFRETVFYEVEGEQHEVDDFFEGIKRSIDKYNSEEPP